MTARPRRAGAALAELVICVVILSIAGALIALPMLTAARGLGPSGAIEAARIAALLQEGAERAAARLSTASQAEWKTMAASPAAPLVKTLGEAEYEVAEAISCVTEDFKNDPSCGAGYAFVTVTVRRTGGGAARSISFIETRRDKI